ncbi:hypothetical protein HYV12_01695 [Candidatus Dojkabacteria bacterium]|nr:hypothetical protein [Candidatus Dojkabacteria bacterium]
MNTAILFSHGFGIRKDNLGLFIFLSEKLQRLGYITVLFDYYEYNEETKEVYTIPFSKHAEILQAQIEKVKKEYPGKDIKIVAQSQGCIIPTLCDMTGISQVIGISPFFLTDRNSILERYNARPDSTTDFSSISRRKHSDGKITVIPPEYWTERFNTNQYDLYNKLAQKTSLTLIYGNKDNLATSADIKNIRNTKIIETESDHDFTGENKEILYEILLKEIKN